MSDSSRPHGLQPSRLLRPWDFPGKSTGVGCHRLLCLQVQPLPAQVPVCASAVAKPRAQVLVRSQRLYSRGQPCSQQESHSFHVLRTILPYPRGDQSLSPLGTVGEKMGPCPVLPTCRTAYIAGQWRGRKQGGWDRCAPLTEPGRPAPLPSVPFGSDFLPTAPWKLRPVSPLHLWCYSIIPTFEMKRQVLRGEVACPSQLASKGRSPDSQPALSPSTACPGPGDDRKKGICQGWPACAHVEKAKAETLLGAEDWKTPPFLVGSLVGLLPHPSESGWNKTTSYPAFSGADGQEAMDWHQSYHSL